MALTIEQVTEALHQLEKRNKIPILIYTILSGLSFLILFILAAKFFWDGDYKSGLALLAPTGLIGVCGERMLRIWSDSVKVITLFIEKNSKDEN